MATSLELPFFVRDKDCMKYLRVDPSHDPVSIANDEASNENMPKQVVKVAAWSPDGMALAFVDPAAGVTVIDLSQVEGTAPSFQTVVIEKSSKATQGLYWSPLGANLVTISVPPKGSTEPNLQIWRRNVSDKGCESGGGTGEYLLSASFHHPKLATDRKVVKWTADEMFCGRLTHDGKIQLHDGADLTGAALHEFEFAHGAQKFDFALGLRPRVPLKARLAAFVPDSRDDLQRVSAPAEVSIWEVMTSGHGLQVETQKKVTNSVAAGQSAELMFSPSATAMLALCTTEVDETGKSYYGGAKLMLISHDGGYVKDLMEPDETMPNGAAAVQAVSWSTTRDEFILIRGFQPAQTTLWVWDAKSNKAAMAKVLIEKAHRNFIKFNDFGSLVCLAGFGNLAGEIDFFGRTDEEKCEYARISSCVANCTVSAEWAPDGRHLLTACLFPRMRVDNGLHLWKALTGTKVVELPSEELYEVQWRPEPQGSVRFADVLAEEIKSATQNAAQRAAENPAAKKTAYRPPKARGADGSSTVAAMMRGEVAAPDDERRGRRPWQARDRRAEGDGADPQSSPGLGPRESPPEPKAASLSEEGDAKENRLPSPAPAGTPPVPPVSSPSGGPRVPPPSRPPPPPEPVPTAPWAAQERPTQRQQPARSPPRGPISAPGSPEPPAAAVAGLPPLHQAASSPLASPLAKSPVSSPLHMPASPPMQPPSSPPLQPPGQPHGGLGPSSMLGGAPAAPVPRRQQGREAPQQQPQHQAYPGQRQPNQQPPSHIDPAIAAYGTARQIQPPMPYGAGANPYAMQQQQQQQQQRQAQAAAAFAAQQRQQGQPLQGHHDMRAGYPHHPQQHPQPRQAAAHAAAQQAYAQAQAKAQAQAALSSPSHQGERGKCPTNGWQYMDPKGVIQGPFTLLEMQLWNSMGYFRPDLRMRCDPSDAFVQFSELFPPPAVPFESPPRRVPGNSNSVPVGGW